MLWMAATPQHEKQRPVCAAGSLATRGPQAAHKARKWSCTTNNSKGYLSPFTCLVHGQGDLRGPFAPHQIKGTHDL